MTRRKRIATATGLVLAGFALVVPAVLAVPGTSATVRFGNDDVGSPFPPITEHDESGNGKFNLIPRTVTITRGGTVTYDILVRFGVHQPVLYAAGTTPDDIAIQGPFPFVNDPTGRVRWELALLRPHLELPLQARGRRPHSTNQAATWSFVTSLHTLRSSTCTAGFK